MSDAVPATAQEVREIVREAVKELTIIIQRGFADMNQQLENMGSSFKQSLTENKKIGLR